MKTLRDVVELPPIRLVVQLADADAPDAALQDEILQGFVVTREIATYLDALLLSLQKGEGVGCFVKGHYGSGKSHFLSFLSLLLRRPEGWARVPDADRYAPLRDRRYLQVRVALQGYAATVPLEDILTEAAEAEAGRLTGRREVLGDHRFLLENFNGLLLERHPDFLARHGLSSESWQRLCREHSLDAAARVAAFLDTLPNNPLRTRSQRGRALHRLFEIAREKDLAGVVFLIDELSEFLKARPSARAFNDDLRYLQFLGEQTEHQPLWVVATLQEMIEEIGFEDQELYTRIKERYRLRFSLSSRHVEDLIAGRLVRHRPGAAEVIAGVYRGLAAAFPDLGLTAERFDRIYPVHPATLAMLENLMGLFSQHRGVVDFVHARLAGDPARRIPGMLDGPADRLLTSESLFDHFQDRLQERPEHAPYVNVAWRWLERDVPRLFESERDRDLALRCVKILILVELSPLERPRTARDLAHLVVRRVSSVDSSVNYLYVKERILDRLVDESSYVKRTPAADPLDAVYAIDLETNVAQTVQARTRQALRGLDVGPDLWERILRLVDRETLPLNELPPGQAALRHLYWSFTARDGYVLFGDLRGTQVPEMVGLVDALEDTERDWLLLLGTPHQAEAQVDLARRLFEFARNRRFAPLVAAWIPREPATAELDACLSVLAQRQVREQALAEGAAGAPVAAALTSAIETGMARLREIVVDCYQGGRFLFASGEERFPAEVGPVKFEKVLLAMFGPSFDKVYPEHRKVKPLNDLHHREDLDRLWKHVVLPGAITQQAAREQNLEKAIEGVLMPLGLVKRPGKEYVLVSEVGRHPLLAEVLRAVVPGQAVPYERLYRTFRKGPYGIVKELFALLVAVLVHLGYCSAYKNGRAVPVETPGKIVGGGVDAIGEGRVLDREQRGRLGSIAFLVGEAPEAAAFSLATQRDLWKKAAEQADRLRVEVERVRTVLRRCQGYQSMRPLPVDRIQAAAAALDEALTGVRHEGDSREGLERLLRAATPELLAYHHTYLQWREFLERDLDAWQRLHRALSTPPAVDGDLAARLAALQEGAAGVAERVERGTWGELWRDFQLFVEAYADAYSAAHEAFYARPDFGAWAALSNGAGYRALQRLSRLYGVEVENDAVAVRRLLDAAPRPCRLNVREGIALNWRCACGFAIGQDLAHAAPAAIEARIQAGLQAYQEALAAPATRERIEVYAGTLEEVGRSEVAARLADLLVAVRRGRVAKDPAAFLRLASEAVLDEVSRAMSGHVVLVDRDLADLAEAIEGRVLPPSRLRDAFDRWLGSMPGDAYVRVGAAAGVDPRGILRRAELAHDLPDMGWDELAQVAADPATPEEAARQALERLLKEAAAEASVADLRRLGDALTTSAGGLLLRLLAALRDERPEEDPVARYTRVIAHLPLQCDTLRHLQFHGGAVPPYLIDEAEAAVEQAVDAHDRAYRESAAAVMSVREVSTQLVQSPCVILLLDAMRWDLWERFRPHLEAALPERSLEVRPIQAVTPTLTLENRLALLGDLPAVILTAADRSRHREDVSRLLEARHAVTLLHFNFVDERIHGTHLGPHDLYAELELELDALVIPYLEQVPAEATVLLLADHGFTWDAGREPPYAHGGATPFERIVPCVRFGKVGDG